MVRYDLIDVGSGVSLERNRGRGRGSSPGPKAGADVCRVCCRVRDYASILVNCAAATDLDLAFDIASHQPLVATSTTTSKAD